MTTSAPSPTTSAEPAATAMEADPAALFDDELTPMIRRLGERGRGADGPIDEADAATREAVWQSLASLGALRSVAGDGPPPLRQTLPLAELMGRALYQSPYFDTLTAAELFATAAPSAEELLGAIAAGEVTVAIAARADGSDDPRRPGPIEIEAGGGRMTGERRFVGFAADVDFVCVVGRTGTAPDAGITAALVPVDQPGVTVRRHDDIGRGELYQVAFDSAEVSTVSPGSVPAAAWAAVLARARLRHASYLVGLSLGAVELSAGYARRRQIFGRPLAQFQAPAFRLAQLASRAEAVRTMVHQTGAEADAGSGTALPACQALLLAGELALEAGAEAVQLHGSYGLTMSCDAQRFYRRAVVDAMLLGTGRDLRRHAFDLLTGTAVESEEGS